MSKSHSIQAGTTRLIFVDDSLPGITRRKAGRGWVYHDPEGNRITRRAEIDRLNRVALPPAYCDAWFCPADNGHILAVGYDDRGRKQYRYHPEFRSYKEGEKFDGCANFGRLLPLIRKRVEADLASPSLTRERAIASIVRLLDTGAIRVGNESYAQTNKSFGATTLRMRHAKARGNVLTLRFRAKSGKDCQIAVSDKGLIRFVRKMQDLPGQHLFQYLDDQGNPTPIDSADVNDYLRETAGANITAKNFRTWHASALSLEILIGAQDKVALKDLLNQVSNRLGNTPVVARRAYIHPAVVALVERQESWREQLELPRKTQWLSRHERALIDLLKDAPAAADLLVA